MCAAANDSKAVDFAIKAYESARAEIMHRMEVRERLTQSYLIASITLLIAFAGAAGEGKPLPIWSFIISPLLALIVAVQISGQVKSIEKVANFIRFDLNDFFVDNKAWAPHWDVHTKQDGAAIDKEKTKFRFASQFMGLHFPSVAAVMSYGYRLFFAEGPAAESTTTEGTANLGTAYGTIDYLLWILALFLIVSAVWTSFQTYEVRKAPLPREIKTP